MDYVNLVDGKRAQRVIRNYNLPQVPFMNFLYHKKWFIIYANLKD